MAHKGGKHSGNFTDLEQLQIRLSKMQRGVIADERKVLVIIEGRDAAGKDGIIKHIVEHMSPRETRVVALGVPTDHDRRAWYFQRWCQHLPVSGEITIFNRSWYNRAGVEQVMGFCTDAEYEDFMQTVVLFEQMLVHSGFTLVKYYLDITKGEQKRRLRERKHDPLQQWKSSPIDKLATKNWEKYSVARNEMLTRTQSLFAPWIVIKADDKAQARMALIRDLISRGSGHGHPGHDFPAHGHDAAIQPDPTVAFVYDDIALENGWLAE